MDTSSEQTSGDCDTDTKNCSWQDNIAFWIMVIVAITSEGLPFISEFCGVKVNGHGIFHILHGLYFSDCKEVQEGLETIVIETESENEKE